jgi:hydroxymethylpyrimidine kinase/phosphomethylpyrimidine kinase
MGRTRPLTPVVCSIGTTDPWNAAGIGLDVLVLAECGVRAVTVVTGISAQDGDGISVVAPVDPGMIRAQWEALRSARVAALRIGALSGPGVVREVAAIARTAGVPVVYDPVLAASRGGRFADAPTVAAIRELLGHATVCTPNLAEAGELTGLAVADVAGMFAAARAIVALGAGAALVTGGHLAGDPTEVLVDGAGEIALRGTRVPGSMRGTGCVLAAALAAELALGTGLRDAVDAARAFVRKKIAGARDAGDFRTAY